MTEEGFQGDPIDEQVVRGLNAAIDERDAFYEALVWISEYPNREHIYSENDGVELAEYARDVLARHEANRA